MKNIAKLLATTAIIALSSAAYANDATVKTEFDAKKNGGYEASSSSSKTSASGTVNAADKKVDVDVDADGATSKTIKTESVKDPKGLWNKQKSTTKTEIDADKDGNLDRSVTKVKKNADGTNVKSTTDTKVDVDEDGNYVTTTEIEKKTDPKGLFNSRTDKATVKVRNGQVIERTTDTDD
ncbi:MAG TPA: hypothetical protein VGF14_03845 [Alphaproteobacteria bacterium]